MQFKRNEFILMEQDENAREIQKIYFEEENEDYLERICDDILERRLKETKEEEQKLIILEDFSYKTERKLTFNDARIPQITYTNLQKIEKFARSDLLDCFNKETIFNYRRSYHLFTYDSVHEILSFIKKCKELRTEKGKKFIISDCCGFCQHYGRYLLFGMSVCKEKEIIEQLQIDLSCLKPSKRFTGNDIVAVFVNWGLKTHVVRSDLKFIFPELFAANSNISLPQFKKENWNEVLKSLLPVLDLMKFDNKLEMKTLLKVLLMLSISQEIHPESSQYVEQCIRKLYIRIISENWSEQEMFSLVNLLHEKCINFYAQVTVVEKLHTATKKNKLSSYFAFMLIQDRLSCNITEAVPELFISHMYTVLEKWEPLKMNAKEIYFLTKCLRMCVCGLPYGAKKWEFLRYAERWLNELKNQMRFHSMDSIKVQYYISQIVADWYAKYPKFVESVANTSTLYK